MQFRAFFLTVALACGLAGASAALTISETTFGDFLTTNEPSDANQSIGTLDFGLNTVTGTITSQCASIGTDIGCIQGPDSTDVFLMTIAAGEALLSVSLTTNGSGPTGFNPSYAMLDAATFAFTHNDALAAFNTNASIIDGVPIGAGTYIFGVGQGLADVVGSAVYDWTLSFEVGVAPVVPLPAGLPLLLAGLGALALVRR